MSELQVSVLGGLLTDTTLIPDIRAVVSPADFTGKYAAVADAIFRIHDKGDPVDVITVGRETDLQLTAQIMQGCWTTANVEFYAKELRKESQQRELRQACADALQQPDVDSAVAHLRDSLDSLTSDSGSYKTFAEVIADGVSAVQRAREGENAVMLTGLPDVDKATGGFRRGQLVGIAARPSTGKTAFVMQAIAHAGRSNPVGFISAEMASDQLGKRWLANMNGLDLGELNRGEVSDADMHRLTADVRCYVDENTFDIDAIAARASEWKRKYGIKTLVVDHMQLVECKAYDSRLQKLGHISRSLKKLAKRLDICVVVLLQLNRQCESEGRRPRLSDIRDCGDIEQDLDTAIFLHIKSRTDLEMELQIGVLKNRDGVAGWRAARFKFMGRTQRWMEML